MGLPPCSAWPDVVAVTLISGLVNLSPLHRLQYTKIWVCMSLKVTCPLLRSWGITSQIWGETTSRRTTYSSRSTSWRPEDEEETFW